MSLISIIFKLCLKGDQHQADSFDLSLAEWHTSEVSRMCTVRLGNQEQIRMQGDLHFLLQRLWTVFSVWFLLTFHSSQLSFMPLSLDITQIKPEALGITFWICPTCSLTLPISSSFSTSFLTLFQERICSERKGMIIYLIYMTYCLIFKNAIFKQSEWNNWIHSTYASDNSVIAISFSYSPYFILLFYCSIGLHN